MMGTRAPSTMPAASAFARKIKFFASMLPASRSGTTSIWASCHLGPDALHLHGVRINRVVKCERAVKQAADDLAALSHLAQGGSINRGRDFDVTVSTADRIATRGTPSPISVKRSMAF